MVLSNYYNVDFCLVYTELNLLLIGNMYNYVKYKFHSDYFFNFFGQFLSVYYFFLIKLDKNFFIVHWNKMKYLFFSFITNHLFFRFGHLKLEGRGYRLYNYFNYLILKLGYSHLCYFLLPFDLMFFSKRKKSNYKLVGSNIQLVGEVLKGLQYFRIPNRYKRKGIFFST